METIKLGVIVAKVDFKQEDIETQIIMPEPMFYRELAVAAKPLNIDLFILSSMDNKDTSPQGYRLIHDVWKKQFVPEPDLIYDRCFFTSAKQKQAYDELIRTLSRRKQLQFINGNLPNKLLVFEALRTNEQLIAYLPYTEELKNITSISKWLRLYEEGVVLKPTAGMHGKGVIHVLKQKNEAIIRIVGRNLRNELIDTSFNHELNAYRWIYHFKKELNYLIQPYLPLQTHDHRPFDIRVLMQKDYTGKWQQSGSVARVGQSLGLTSNRHGGGVAEDPIKLLTLNLGEVKAEHIMQKVHMISGQTVIALEENFGRFGELALDFGVTKHGSIWLLECNSKPGRQSFNDLYFNPSHVYERPLQYAKYLHQRKYHNQAVL